MKYIGLFFMSIMALLYLSTGCSRATIAKAEEKYAIGEYYDAAAIYKKIYNKTKSKDRERRGLLAYRMGNCYRLINYSARAEASYINAVRYEYPDSTALLYLAESLKKNGKYKDAIGYYEQFLKIVPDSKLANNGIIACKLAPEWKSKPSLYQIKKMDKFNSRRGDFSPMLLPPDADQLYFTSFRDQTVGDKINGVTGARFNDIFVVLQNEQKEWLVPSTIESEINSEFDDGVCSFTADGKTMYFTRGRMDPERPAPAEIYSATRTEASWGTPKVVPIVKDSVTSVGHPAVSPDGDFLLFVSDMPGGQGGKDIWMYHLTGTEQGMYENMGPIINTPGDEMFPFVRDSVLYFSSDGHPGMGGLDIFKATKVEGRWEIENMRYPINSNADDFGITFFPKKEEGFYSSNRGDARGWDHLFSFAYPTFSTLITGIVWDSEDEPVGESVIRIVGDNGTNKKVISKLDGTYTYPAEPGVTYIMQASKEGYLNAKEEVMTLNESKDHTYLKDFTAILIGKPVLIENIFYDFDKATLRKESEASLNELIKVLNDNPNVSIELGANTDMVGTDEYNLNLSQRRAESVCEYLIKQGIEAGRLTAKGYGESLPVTVSKKLAATHRYLQQDSTLTPDYIMKLTPQLQDSACQINRRTEFRVLKTTYNLY